MLKNEINLKIFSNNKIFLNKNLNKIESFLKTKQDTSLYYKKNILKNKTALTLLRSPHVNKKSREQFFQSKYTINFKIYNVSKIELSFLNDFLKKNISVNYLLKITTI